METIRTQVISSSEEFKRKHAAMSTICDKLRDELQTTALSQGNEASQKRHLKAGKFLPRDRVEKLLDPDTPFVELLPLAGCRAKDGVRQMGGIGIGGASNEHSLRKSMRMMEIVEENRLPLISCIETAGADLTQQAKVFHIGGGMFRALARLSKKGIPTIAIVFGSSTAGGAYAPGLADYVIMVKVFLAGPPLVKMATGEEADEENLGGAEMHSKKSGVSDYLANDESHAIFIARQIVAYLNYSKLTPLPRRHFMNPPAPKYDPEEILGIIGDDIRAPYDAREVIARMVDGSLFHEWKPAFGTTIVCGFAYIHGFEVGILANNGVLLSDTSNKAAHFIQICDKRAVPLLFLQNITGFMVGTKQEQEGIIKHGSKLINAVSNAQVPSITIMMGASYGAGNYAMMGRAYRARFQFAWPNSKVAVMGSDQLVGVMTMINRDASRRAGRPFDEEKANQVAAMFKQRVEAESECYYITSECLDDGIIDPRDTRDVIGFCLSVIHNSPIESGSSYGISRM